MPATLPVPRAPSCLQSVGSAVAPLFSCPQRGEQRKQWRLCQQQEQQWDTGLVMGVRLVSGGPNWPAARGLTLLGNDMFLYM